MSNLDDIYVEVEIPTSPPPTEVKKARKKVTPPKPNTKTTPKSTSSGLPMSPIKTSHITPAPAPVPASTAAITPAITSMFDFTKTKLTPAQQLYIVAYATRGTKASACAIADVTMAMVNEWMKNEEFSRELSHAVDVVADTLEQELIDRALSTSDRLLEKAVKAHKPQKYADRTDINANIVHSFADLARKVAEEDEANDDVIDV